MKTYIISCNAENLVSSADFARAYHSTPNRLQNIMSDMGGKVKQMGVTLLEIVPISATNFVIVANFSHVLSEFDVKKFANILFHNSSDEIFNKVEMHQHPKHMGWNYKYVSNVANALNIDVQSLTNIANRHIF